MQQRANNRRIYYNIMIEVLEYASTNFTASYIIRLILERLSDACELVSSSKGLFDEVIEIGLITSAYLLLLTASEYLLSECYHAGQCTVYNAVNCSLIIS